MYKNYTKRILDIIFSIILLPITLLLILIIGIAIKIEDQGPMFYCAERLGKNRSNFKMFKIRSMKINAPDLRNDDGSTFNSEYDPRLTKVGLFIRKTSLDEIPQIINVLIGNMSFIGPRPDLPEHITYYKGKEITKLTVLPGITGYNQAYYRNSTSWKDRLKNDIYYVENISFCLDLKVFFKTLQTVLFRKGVFVAK